MNQNSEKPVRTVQDLINWFLSAVLIVVICFVGAVGCYIYKMYEHDKEIAAKDTQIDSLSTVIHSFGDSIYPKTVMNEANVKFWIDYFGIKKPQAVFNQIIHESGHLKSPLSVEHGNITGMKIPGKRKTAMTYKAGDYAGFPNFIECIRDYSIYQSSYYRSGDYYEFLKNMKYSEDSTYIDSLKN